MVLRPQEGNLRLVSRLFVSCLAQPRMRLNNLKTCMRFLCLGLNTIIDSIKLVPQLLMKQIDSLPTQYRHNEHLLEEVWCQKINY